LDRFEAGKIVERWTEINVPGDYSIIELEREGMVTGPETTAYGLFADFVNAVKGRG
jgi:hypothetical protein